MATVPRLPPPTRDWDAPRKGFQARPPRTEAKDNHQAPSQKRERVIRTSTCRYWPWLLSILLLLCVVVLGHSANKPPTSLCEDLILSRRLAVTKAQVDDVQRSLQEKRPTSALELDGSFTVGLQQAIVESDLLGAQLDHRGLWQAIITASKTGTCRPLQRATSSARQQLSKVRDQLQISLKLYKQTHDSLNAAKHENQRATTAARQTIKQELQGLGASTIEEGAERRRTNAERQRWSMALVEATQPLQSSSGNVSLEVALLDQFGTDLAEMEQVVADCRAAQKARDRPAYVTYTSQLFSEAMARLIADSSWAQYCDSSR